MEPSETTTTDAPAADAPVTDAPVTPEATAPVTPEPEVDPFDNTEADKFDRAYVAKLREEAAERRVAAKRYDDVFSNYSEAEQAVLLDVLAGLTSEEKQEVSAKQLLQIAQHLLGQEPEGGEETPPAEGDEPDPEDKPLTIKEWRALQEKEREEAAASDAAKAIVTEATDLGYEEGTADYVKLLHLALNSHEGDLKAADAAIKAEKQAIIDGWIAEQKAKGAKFPSGIGETHGAPPADPTGGEPKTFASARASLEARLAKMAEPS